MNGNLCLFSFVTKVFRVVRIKCILEMRIQFIDKIKKVDLGEKTKHIFKRNFTRTCTHIIEPVSPIGKL